MTTARTEKKHADPLNTPASLWQDWRWQLQNSDTGDMGLPVVAGRYPVLITPYYASLIECGSDCDPIALQCMPGQSEIADAADGADPLGEQSHEKVPGLIHRYRNRVVVIVTGCCAVRCRHCTRKNTLHRFVEGDLDGCCAGWCEYLARHPEVREVIVSGGDPLVLEDDTLDGVLGRLQMIESVEVLRLGTRVPVVLPMRVTGELCRMLSQHRPLWLNTQFNHPREITPESERACRMLVEAGIPVSNQTVLLKGINDSSEILSELCNRLQAITVRPYYVFLCDRVSGTAHFSVAPADALKLANRLRGELGGLALPQFVVDVPGSVTKVPIERFCKE